MLVMGAIKSRRASASVACLTSSLRANVPGATKIPLGLPLLSVPPLRWGLYWLLLRKPVHQIEAYRTRNEHGQNMDQG
jgi:hypothetical protein